MSSVPKKGDKLNLSLSLSLSLLKIKYNVLISISLDVDPKSWTDKISPLFQAIRASRPFDTKLLLILEAIITVTS